MAREWYRGRLSGGAWGGARLPPAAPPRLVAGDRAGAPARGPHRVRGRGAAGTAGVAHPGRLTCCQRGQVAHLPLGGCVWFRRKPKPDPANVTRGLRDQALGLSAAELGLSPTAERPHVW